MTGPQIFGKLFVGCWQLLVLLQMMLVPAVLEADRDLLQDHSQGVEKHWEAPVAVSLLKQLMSVADLEDVAAEELLHYLLALQLNLVEEDQQQFLSGDEGGLPHQLLVASGLELLGLETQSPGLRTLASCQTEKGLAGYLVLDLVHSDCYGSCQLV